MILFITPVYNEEKNIAELLVNMKNKMSDLGYNYKIIIVNDGSTDDTVRIIKSYNSHIPVYLHEYYPNQGVGRAFLEGFRIALSLAQEDDIIVTQEGDNTSDLSILPEMINKINQGFDIVLASCYAPRGGIVGSSFYRLLFSKAANALLKVFFPIKEVRTFSSFYRVYRASSLKDIFCQYGDSMIERRGFECMVEFLIKLKRWGHLKISEVPMLLDTTKRKDKSKMHVFKTIRGYLLIIFKEGVLRRCGVI